MTTPSPAAVLRSICLLLVALFGLAAPSTAGAQAVPAEDVADVGKVGDLEAYVLVKLSADDFMARAAGVAGPLRHGGGPFTGVVRSEDGRIEATFEEGELRRVVYRNGEGGAMREIRVGPRGVRETVYWGAPYEDAKREELAYEEEYMGDAVRRAWSPEGELIVEEPVDGSPIAGEGWLYGLNMWDETNLFYRAIETCQPAKLHIMGTYYRVIGPRDDGCAVEYRYWAPPAPGLPHWAGKGMTCIYRPAQGSAYDFVDILTDRELPTPDCEGEMAELLRSGG